MSAFDEIANSAPPITTCDPLDSSSESSVGDTSDPPHFCRRLLHTARQLILGERRRSIHQLTTFIELLHQAYADLACREALLQLRGDDARVVIDATQLILDEIKSGDAFFRHALYLLVKLAANTNLLPTSLFIQGVNIPMRDPVKHGGFADIYRGTFQNADVAIKKLRFTNDHDRPRVHQAFCREALVWRQLSHPNVLPFVGVDAESFHLTKFVCMVSPWMPHGTLAEYMISRNYKAKQDCPRLMCEIACGLTYLHSHMVIHGDVHVTNILIGAEGRARLADFGLVVVEDTSVGRSSLGIAGHTRYKAPEQQDPKSLDIRRTAAADIYSFGCVCLYLYTGRDPLPHLPTDTSVIVHIINGGQHERPDKNECLLEMSDLVWTMIQMCCDRCPSQRPSMAEVYEKLLQITKGELAPDKQNHTLSTDQSFHLKRGRFWMNVPSGPSSPSVRRQPVTGSTSTPTPSSSQLLLQPNMSALHLPFPREESSDVVAVRRDRLVRTTTGGLITSSTRKNPPLPRSGTGPGRVYVPPFINAPVIDRNAALSAPPDSTHDGLSRAPIQNNSTLVCIGQLEATALILHPIAYLNPSEDGGLNSNWACVRTRYRSDVRRKQESIYLYSPEWRNRRGENVRGEHFGFVEQKIAAVVGPLLGQDVIRVEARIQRGHREASTLPLALIVYTDTENVADVSDHLRDHRLLLCRPNIPADVRRFSMVFALFPLE